ncbi:MAG: hypothetical protein K8L97_14410 [Anaerolineae bacterium]|nr:hypothetical protein [Anaerolineae bacterium]
MAMAAVSADETGSAVVCSGYRGVCRRVGGIVIVQREQGRLALSGGAKCEVLGMKFMVASYEFPVSRKDRMGLRAKGGVTIVLRRFGMCLPLQYLLFSCQLRVSSFQKRRDSVCPHIWEQSAHS